jgi:hypothetical protein
MTIIYTAADALKQTVETQANSAAAATQAIVDKHFKIFNRIKSAAVLGKGMITITLPKVVYDELAPVLEILNYNVQTWPVGVLSASAITISWPISIDNTLSGLSPTNISGIQDVNFKTVFYPKGGIAPYTYELILTDGSIPDGLALIGNTLDGIPTVTGNGYFKIKIIDSTNNTYTETILWDISAVFEDGYPATVTPLSFPANYIPVTTNASTVLSSITRYNIILANQPSPGVYYTLSITMPTAPVDGQIAQFTILNNPVTVTVVSTTIPVITSTLISANSVYRFNYRAATNTWYLI